jgi:hypothetical protein
MNWFSRVLTLAADADIFLTIGLMARKSWGPIDKGDSLFRVKLNIEFQGIRKKSTVNCYIGYIYFSSIHSVWFQMSIELPGCILWDVWIRFNRVSIDLAYMWLAYAFGRFFHLKLGLVLVLGLRQGQFKTCLFATSQLLGVQYHCFQLSPELHQRGSSIHPPSVKSIGLLLRISKDRQTLGAFICLYAFWKTAVFCVVLLP